MAPGRPSRLLIGFCVAWLSEGSCTDQVASAMAPNSAPEQRQSCQLAQTAAQNVAEMIRDKSDDIEIAVGGCHSSL